MKRAHSCFACLVFLFAASLGAQAQNACKGDPNSWQSIFSTARTSPAGSMSAPAT